ncbi:MAG TPA: phosphatase PAP2 family protein [Solirubrobacteraceae bacterium]|nr:phosphatase PAP2 family protein [Solirubrobacteraceae bacterium]
MPSAISIDDDGAAVAVQPLLAGGRVSGQVQAAAEGSARVAHAAPVARTRWWVEALTIVWLCWVYDAITNLAPLRLHAALAHGEGVLALERSLGISPELSLDRWLGAHHTLALAISDYYDNAHFIVTLGLLGYIWWRRADIYRPLRNTLVAVNVIAFAVFLLYPVAPPRMLTGDGFSDIVASTHAFGSWHTGALASAANQLAAMPSLHMAWAGWCGLVLWRLSSRAWVRTLAIVYPCMTALAVLATGNHYVLDVLAGLATLALAAWLCGPVAARLEGRLRARRAGDGRTPALGSPVQAALATDGPQADKSPQNPR